MMKIKNTLLATMLISTMSVASSENSAYSTPSTPNMITSPMGVIINLRKLPTHSNRINAQVPVIKQLSNNDAFKVRKNISKENKIIASTIGDFYRENKDGVVSLETAVKLISDTSQFTSIAINKNISNATERYFTWNILLDKSTGLMISPNRALQHFGFSLPDVKSQINDWIKPCLNPDRKSVPDRCMDAELDSFVQQVTDDGDISSVEPSGIYLKNGNLGVSFDTNKFSPSFEFDLKTKKITSLK